MKSQTSQVPHNRLRERVVSREPASNEPGEGLLWQGRYPSPALARLRLRSGTLSPCGRGELKQARYGYTCRSTIMRLMSAMAFAGLRCLGHALAQFMMVWQR